MFRSRKILVTVVATAALVLGLLAQALPAFALNNVPWSAKYFTENVEFRAATPGDTFQFVVQYTNLGQSSWVKGTIAQEARLGTGWTFGDPSSPAGNSNDSNGGWSSGWIAPNRLTTQQESTVLPGANGTFTYVAKVPTNAAPGRHQIKAQPLVEGASWLENYGYYQGFDVAAAAAHNAPCTTPAAPFTCVQGSATAGTCIAAAVPGCTWKADASGFWSTMTLSDGSVAPGQPYGGGTTWDFFFGSMKKTVVLNGGTIVTLNFP